MREEEFYRICENVNKIGDATNGCFPTVEELKTHTEDNLKSKYIPIIIYFSSDPLTRHGYKSASMKDYKDTVLYCKQLSCGVNLEN